MMPQMNDPMMGGDPNGGMQPMDDPMMGGDPNGGMDMGDEPSEFDTNFDAGVDADENTDPKKYIQQLCGKLSQSLRKYNSEQPQVDSELSKYVAGMILKQSVEGLTDSDKKDIIDKVSGNVSDNTDDDTDSGDDMMQMDNQQPMMESVNNHSLINELFQELTQQPNVNHQNNIMNKPIKNIGFKKKPFTAPNMK